MIRSLIWDAGGSLFNTYPAVVKACQKVLDAYGIEVENARLLGLFRRTTSHAIRTLAETYDLDAEALERRYRAAYAEMPPDVQPPFPGVREVCHYMRERGGRNFIITHRDWNSLRPLLDHYGLRDEFEAWITSEDPYPRKPNPTSILALIRRYDLDREQCMTIGDRPLDMTAGQRAGIHTCLFTRGRSVSEMSADLVVDDFDTLLAWLKAQEPAASQEDASQEDASEEDAPKEDAPKEDECRKRD